MRFKETPRGFASRSKPQQALALVYGGLDMLDLKEAKALLGTLLTATFENGTFRRLQRRSHVGSWGKSGTLPLGIFQNFSGDRQVGAKIFRGSGTGRYA